MTTNKITPDRIADTVDKTADFLEAQGWCYGQMTKYTSEGANYCTLGAIREVEDDWQVRVLVEKQLACALEKVTGQSEIAGNSTYPRIAKWNDRHRNGSNVIAKLRKAAAKIRSGECS